MKYNQDFFKKTILVMFFFVIFKQIKFRSNVTGIDSNILLLYGMHLNNMLRSAFDNDK